MTTSISSDLMLSSVQQRNAKTGNEILGKDDFLKILMVQLQNQDPMNPMNDQDFIAQMATFSSLEQMTNMNNSMDQLIQLESQNSLISYNQFIGKDIIWHKIDEESDRVIEGKGRIQSVQFLKDTVKFTLTDGTELAPANISEVHDLPSETPLIQASTMIGKDATWMDDDNEYSGIVQSVSLKNGVLFLQLKDGQSIKASQLIKIG